MRNNVFIIFVCFACLFLFPGCQTLRPFKPEGVELRKAKRTLRRSGFGSSTYMSSIKYAVEAVKIAPDFQKGIDFLNLIYPAGVIYHQEVIAALKMETLESRGDKWLLIFQSYERLFELAALIKTVPDEAKDFIKFSVRDYTGEFLEAKMQAAGELYAYGLFLYHHPLKDYARDSSVDYFLQLNEILPGYKDVEAILASYEQSPPKDITLVSSEQNIAFDEFKNQFKRLTSNKLFLSNKRDVDAGQDSSAYDLEALKEDGIEYLVIFETLGSTYYPPETEMVDRIYKKKEVEVGTEVITNEDGEEETVPVYETYEATVTEYKKTARVTTGAIGKVVDVNKGLVIHAPTFADSAVSIVRWYSISGDIEALTSNEIDYTYTPTSEGTCMSEGALRVRAFEQLGMSSGLSIIRLLK